MGVKRLVQRLNVLETQIKNYTFEMLLELVNLTYNYATKEVSIRNRMKLPCLWVEGGCETTNLDSLAYAWDTLKSFAMTEILTKDAKTWDYLLTTGQKENQFFFLSEVNDTAKGKNIKL